MRGFNQFLTIAAEIAVSEIVKEKEYNVRFFREFVSTSGESRYREHRSR
jgi:peptide subunit release factor 1 (eRF1)